MVAIIGVLAAVAIPAYNGYRNSAAENAAKSQASEITKAIQACATINTYNDCIGSTNLNVKGTLSRACTWATAIVAGACDVGYKSSTDKACAAAHVKGVGMTYSSCIDINTNTGVVTPAVTGKHCEGADGVCK